MGHSLRSPNSLRSLHLLPALSADPDVLASQWDLLQSTLRFLIYATAGICTVIYILVNTLEAAHITSLTLALVPVAVCSYLALQLASRRLRLAILTWLGGGALSITLAWALLQEPALCFLYLLIPFVVAMLMHWPAGVLAEGLILALAWRLSGHPFFTPLPEPYLLILLMAGSLHVALGWAVTHSFLTTTAWALNSYGQAREELAEARNERMEFRQVQADLLHANQELARLSDRLKAMYQVAEEARRVKEEFVANVSHELRTPLNMIIGFSEMIAQSPQAYGHNLPPALLADINAIQRNSQHLSKLVDDVLSLSQIEAGRVSLSQEWASLPEIIEEAVTAASALFRSKKLYLEAEVAPDLPPIFCDSTRIRQVMLNLLSNAGRFTEQGGVRIRAWQAQAAILVSVSDTGPGIDAENQKRLFEPFQQLDSSIRRRHGGSGLGLSISKNFIELHKGKMWLESEPGAGTTFYCSLPLDTPPPARHAAGRPSFQRWFSEYGRYEPRTREFKAPVAKVVPQLLVLETGEVLSQLIRRYADTVDVLTVHSIEQAIGALERTSAQALIVNEASAEALVPLKEKLSILPFPPPVIGCWLPEKEAATQQLGVSRYLVKPVTRDKLLAAMEALGQQVKSVLLIDDQPELLQLFVRMLSSADQRYRVLQATSGRRALSLLRERRPDAVLLDLVMPGMDGFQLLQEKSRDPALKDIPVVVISSKDPSGTPIVTDTLTVTRSNGLSARELLACIRLLSESLSPWQPAGQALSENPAS